MSKEGADEFKNLVKKEYVTYADLLLKFPGAVSELNYLTEFIPKIKPRL